MGWENISAESEFFPTLFWISLKHNSSIVIVSSWMIDDVWAHTQTYIQ